MKNVEIYSDGSCLGNPGPGGWATILKYNEHEKMISGGDFLTTNNRMELMGVIAGLQALKTKCNVVVTTDSSYVVNAFNKSWVYKWEKENFHKRPNEDLWVELLRLVRTHNVEFVWIKGHNGHYYNEMCDTEAQVQARNHSTSHDLY